MNAVFYVSKKIIDTLKKLNHSTFETIHKKLGNELYIIDYPGLTQKQ